MIFKRRRQRACQQARLWLTQRMEDGLADKTAARLAAHLAGCPTCREWSRQVEYLDGRLQAEQPPYRTLAPADAAYIRAHVQRYTWRKSIMLQSRQAVQGAVTLIFLAVLTAVFIFWQRQSVQPLLEATRAASEAQLMVTLAVSTGELGRYRPLVEQFEQEHPHIRVRLVSTGDVVNPDEENEMRARASSFDVFPYSPNRQGGTEYLLDLRPLLAQDAQFDSDDFLPGLLPAPSEPVWAIPTSAAYQLTYFDKSAFDAAGLPYPDLDWTVEEFLAMAVALTIREGGEVTRWGYIPGQLGYAPLLATQLTSPLGAGDDLRLADPDVAAALQWMGDLYTLHAVSPRLDAGQSSLALINSDMAAMWHVTHLLYDGDNENVRVTAVPRGQHGFAAEPAMLGFATSRGTHSPEAAWQLVSFLSRQPLDTGGFATGPVPARRSVAAATRYWERLPADLAPVLQYTAENSAPPRIAYPAASLLLAAFAAHLDDNIPVAAALTALPTPATTEEVIVVREAESEVPEDAIQITFTSYSYLFDEHRLLANKFRDENPGIVVKVQRPDDTPGVSHNESLLTGNSDCFVESGLAIHDEALRAAILPLGPLLDVDRGIQLEDFYPIQSSYFMEDGELLAIPAFMVTPLFEYNRALFQEANILEPLLDWTLSDFLEIVQQLTEGSGKSKQYGYAEPFEFLIYMGLSLFEVGYIDDSAGIPTFNYESTTEMITWYSDLIRLHGVQMPRTGDPLVDSPQFNTLLFNGQIAMWPFPLSTMHPDGLDVDFEVGIVPVPLGLTGSRGNLARYVHGYYIMADSPHREACWQWIKYLTPRAQAIYMRQRVPAHIATVESREYISSVGEKLAAATQAFTASGRPSPHIEEPSWFFPGHEWLREAYREAAMGASDVATALARADMKFSQYRQCITEQQALDNYRGQVACAVSVDPALADRYRIQPGD
jgi:ABC-type glycerol-3-phosphate transport system substrate-binding protein